MDDHARNGLDHGVLLAFLGSGAVWVVGFSVALGAVHLGAIATIYVTLGSLALASRRWPTGRVAAGEWVAAVLLLGAVLATWTWLALSVAVVLGSVLFLTWFMTGFLLLGAFTGRSPTDLPRGPRAP